MTGPQGAILDLVRGDTTGLEFPAHPRALLEAGPAFLTEAFRNFGMLAADNSVARIVRAEPCHSGSTGQKLFLTLEYARPDAALDTELFVKFSRDFDDAIRDLQAREMETEVHLATLSRHPAFPVTVPATWFADYNSQNAAGLLITSVIPFGLDGIEPQHVKCMDHELGDPLEYYRALLRALARLAGAHKAGRLSPELERIFPFDRAASEVADKIPYDAAQLRAMVGQYAELASAAPQLFPPHLTGKVFIAGLERDVVRFLEHERQVMHFLHADPDFIALCHWNANIDNAWFWRDESGALQCGLFDWGGVRQFNLCYALWGCLLGAQRYVWDDHFDELLSFFLAELRDNGGPELDPPTVKLHLGLYVAAKGIASALIAPDRIVFRMPDVAQVSGPYDERLQANPRAFNFLHVFINFLNVWQSFDVAAMLDTILAGGE